MFPLKTEIYVLYKIYTRRTNLTVGNGISAILAVCLDISPPLDRTFPMVSPEDVLQTDTKHYVNALPLLCLFCFSELSPSYCILRISVSGGHVPADSLNLNKALMGQNVKRSNPIFITGLTSYLTGSRQ